MAKGKWKREMRKQAACHASDKERPQTHGNTLFNKVGTEEIESGRRRLRSRSGVDFKTPKGTETKVGT